MVMTQNKLRLGRRSALLMPLGLAGCGLFNGEWFGSDKPPAPRHPHRRHGE